MADEMKITRAKEVYALLCTALEHRNWNFEKFDEDLVVRFAVNGEDIPVQMAIFVEAEKELVTVLSPFTFKMSENKRIEGAIAACTASFGMADGSFDYDMASGGIVFRLSTSYTDSTLSEGVLQYMISCSVAMVDKYNDRFLALEKGMISIENFINMD